jgi:3-oxoacyl-[acyl-carrier-protein] synthase-3
VTSEAPPLAAGLAAALHARIGLPRGCAALEVGGACTGLVAAMWLGRKLLPEAGAVLVVAVEAPSRWLKVKPGAAGEAAALFGEAASACLLTAAPARGARRIREMTLGSDGGAAGLLRALPTPAGVALEMDGPSLASRAVRLAALAVDDLVRRHGITAADLEAVVAHAGNGRMAALLARKLGLPEDRLWSETARTGNLGSVSLPAAWVCRAAAGSGAAAWVAVGAGLSWGAVLLNAPVGERGVQQPEDETP